MQDDPNVIVAVDESIIDKELHACNIESPEIKKIIYYSKDQVQSS